MKTTTKLFIGIIIYLNFCINSFGGETIRIAGEEWRPFSSKDLKYYGLMNRIITESFAIGNVKVEYDFFPGARALHFVKYGDWDATGGWTPSDERAKDYYFSETLFEEILVFFHLKANPFNWKTWNDLKGIEIGTVYKSYYGKEFEKAEKEGKLIIQKVPSDTLNFRKIIHKRIAIVPKNLDAGLDLLQTEFKPEERELITYHPLPLDKGPLVLMFSKKVAKNRKMLILFNQGLRQLKKNGRYDQLFKESRSGDYI
ncbi:amino acid ABC transporter substrate-binding protein, partial [Candidatus Magnetomorum sp. HK-1]